MTEAPRVDCGKMPEEGISADDRHNSLQPSLENKEDGLDLRNFVVI